MALLVGGLLGQVNAEESSIMAGATVPTAQLHSVSPDGDVLIHNSYKSYIWTASGTNPVDAAIALS